jgi:hypothetical protein
MASRLKAITSRVNDRSLPGGEHIDVAQGEAAQTRFGGSAAEQHRRGEQGVEASTGQGQATLDLREHRGEIGPLWQAITPAPLQGLDHGGGDPGLIGQITKREAQFLTAPPQHQPQIQTLLLLGLNRAGIRAGPLAGTSPPKSWTLQSHGLLGRSIESARSSRGFHSPSLNQIQHPSARSPSRNPAIAVRWQVQHRMAQGFRDPADLSVAPFPQLNLQK